MESRFDLVLHPILGDQSQVMVKVSRMVFITHGETKLVVGVERAASLNVNILSALQLTRCSVLCAPFRIMSNDIQCRLQSDK
jgi:hypothetical protein